MTKAKTKQPTVQQAVDIIRRSVSEKFKRDQIAWWRELFGDQYADQVQAAVNSKRK